MTARPAPLAFDLPSQPRRAPVDLPDPLHPADSRPASAAETDDLLSQLAGEEIDRLLAEDDHPLPGAPASLQPGEETLTLLNSVEADASSIAAQVDALAPVPAAAEDGTTAVRPAMIERRGAAGASPASAAMAAALQSELTTRSAGPPGKVREPPSAAHEVAAELDRQLASMDIQALSAASPQGISVAAADGSPPAEHAPDASVDPPRSRLLAILLFPLELLNAPFETLPDSIRMLVGKIALVTMVNAGAVILYVWKFRGH